MLGAHHDKPTSRREAKRRRDNTGHGSQFTGAVFTGVPACNGIAITWMAKQHGKDRTSAISVAKTF
jgi:hypothetical protein